MTLLVRLILAALVWALAGAVGWWLQQPSSAQAPVARSAADAASASQAAPAAELAALAARVNAADPMGLRRSAVAALAAALPVAAPATAASETWRLAALVVRGPDRYAVLTSGEQPALKLRAGELLPDGDRIKAVHANHIEIQSPRGRLRTLYLIEP